MRLVRAAGAIVWRFRDRSRVSIAGQSIQARDIEVLLVHRPRYGDWSWPKGKTELNEPLPVAAVREVEEETGLAVTLGVPLTVQRYRLGTGQTKEVHYWVGCALDDSPALRTRMPVQRASRREIDQSRWVSPSRAESMVTRRGDRRLLMEVLAMGEAGLLVTSSLSLVRHSKAVSRSSWDGEEATRPLTRLGARQSIDLVDILSAFGTDSVMSSPWTRCRATVGPYAALAGLPVQTQDALTEASMAAKAKPGVSIIKDLLATPDVATSVCVHRPTMPELMGPLIEHTPSRLRGSYPASSPWLSTAEMLLVHIAHAREPQIIAVERHSTYTKAVIPA